MSDQNLFSEFPPVSAESWNDVVNADLKGADYEKKLVWRTDEGFKVRPYYRAEDLNGIDYLNSLPDDFPYVRGTNITQNNWEIVQEINETDFSRANEIARDAALKGATIIAFNVRNIGNYDDLKLLLAGLDLEKTGIQFNHSYDYVSLVTLFRDYIIEKGYKKDKVKGSVDFDAVMYCLKNSRFYISKEEDLNKALQLIKLTDDMPEFKVINVNGLAMHNAGSTIVQEIGYALGIANEYLAYGVSKGISVDKVACKMQMTLSVGSNYFMEIAKLRAIRLLWATMLDQYKPQNELAYKLYINTVASSWNKTIYDPYVNILRSTTEGMAAAIGGADSISLKPFDVALKPDDDFSRRNSRNIQVILKEEAFFNKVVDPAAGSYYVENLTDSIAEHSWNLFRHVEAEGGIINLIEKGEVKAEIEKSCRKRDMDIATRKYILLGTNQYPNTGEIMYDKVKMVSQCDSSGLKSYRGGSSFEEIRLQTEQYSIKNGTPKVFLLKVGNPAMRQARAGFITNFFGCAGYKIIDNAGFDSVAEGVEAAFVAKADLIVICSSDEEYATLGVEAAKLVKNNNASVPFIVAGNPTDAIELLKNAGADDFIHVRTNVLESLRSYNKLLLK
jgi:methylmalonyl-CoA mutase